MSVFDPIELKWDGADYTIPPNRVLGAIARIEDILTLKEIHDGVANRGAISLSKVAMAYGSVIRYAGAKVSDDEVYEAMFGGHESGQVIITYLQTLLVMLTPPARKNTNMGESQRPSPPVDVPLSQSTTSS